MDTFTFNGKSSASYNIYVIGTNDAELPEYDYNSEVIEGRTRDVHIRNNRFKNKNVVYHCYCTQNAAENVTKFLGIIMADNIYGRLENTINPEYYRIGTYAGGTKQQFYGSSNVSTFDLIFDCDPRKFLKGNVSNVSEYTGDGKYVGDEFINISVGSLTWLQNRRNGVYHNPVFYLENIQRVEVIWKKTSSSSEVTDSIVATSEAATLFYDTETKYAYSASGDSREDKIYSRLFRQYIIPPDCYRVYIKPVQRPNTSSAVAKVALREYIL